MFSTITHKIIPTLFCLISLIFIRPCEAQRWRTILDFPAPSGVKNVVVLPNGDIISLVSTDSIFLVAIDQQGKLKWSKNIGEGIGLVLELIDNNLFVGGKSGSSFSDVAILLKLTQNGNLVWQKNYYQGFISSITKNGNGYLLGGNGEASGSSSNSILYKVDFNGLVQWTNEYDVYSNSSVVAILDFGNVLFLVINASTVGVGFEGTVLIKANSSDGQMLWRRDKELGYYYQFPDEYEFPRPIDVSINAANEIVIVAPVNSSNGVIYSYSLDGDQIIEVQLGKTLPHALQILPNGDYLLAGILGGTSEGTNAVVERRTPAGSMIWQRTIGQGSFFTIGMNSDTIIAAGTDMDFRAQPVYKPYIIKMTSDGRVFDSALRFEIVEDLNDNCIADISDQPLPDIILNVDNRFFTSGTDGTLMLDADTGWYDFKVDLPPYLQLCAHQQSVYIPHPDEIVSRNILIKREQCADLSVGITYTEFIRGEIGQLFVQYNNLGSVQIQDAVLNIRLDDHLQLEAVSSDYMITVDGIEINIPIIPPNFSDRIRIDVGIDEELLLFSTICVEASITPHNSCDATVVLWNGPDLKLTTSCESNNAVFRIKNDGAEMTESVSYELFADGFMFEDGTIQLLAGQEKVFNIASGGSTISIRSRQVPGYPFTAVLGGSIEGCGLATGQAGSLGIVRMFDPASPTPWTSKACFEVRDQYSSNRIFEIPRGLGRYHMIDSTQRACEFSIMYKNDTGIPVDKMELFVSPGYQFDLLTFRECASSHVNSFELLGSGIIRITYENMALFPGDQVQYRFAIDLVPSGSDDFVSIVATGIINDSIPVELYQGFYNRNVPNDIVEISPFVSIHNGQVIGRGHTWEFNQDLHVSENGIVFYAGDSHEFGVDSRVVVMAVNSDNSVIWQRTFAFEEGGVLVRKIISSGEGRILLIGSIDDNQEPDNYVNDAYSFMLMLDENGHELWRSVWKPGNGTFVGGTLNNGHFYNDDKILLLGARYTSNGSRNFLMETDIYGDIHWIRDFSLGVDIWGDQVTAINSIPMKVSSVGNVFIVGSNNGFEAFILKFDNNAGLLEKSKYFHDSDMQSIYPKDLVILENEELLLIGDGYSFDPEYNITSFGIIIQLDSDLHLMSETKILDQFNYIELNAADIWDDVVYAAGAIQVDTASRSDAIIIQSDLSGANAQILRIADFGARDYAYNIDIGDEGRVYAGVQTQTIDNFYNLQMGYFWVADTITSFYTISGEEENIRIFPNPAGDYFKITLDKEIFKTRVYDLNGRVIQLTSVAENTFSIRDLPAGIYLVVVYTTDDMRYLTKLIKAE